MDYCMWMDADDILKDTEKEKFLNLKQTLQPDTDIVMMKYNTAFDEAGKPSFSYFRERWIRNCSKYRWVGAVHEVVPPVGRLVYSDIAISHKKMRAGDPDRNLRIYRKLLAEGKTLDLRQQYYYGRELYYHKQYEEAVSEQPGQPEQQEQMEQLGQPGQQVLPVREQLFRLHQDFRLP